MNQVLPLKKCKFVGNNRLSNQLRKKRLGDFTGLAAENVFSPNYHMVMLNHLYEYELFIIDLAHPLNASLVVDEIRQLENLPIGYQQTKKNHPSWEDWFFQGYWQALSEQEISFLYSSWLKKVSFFLECRPDTVILPLSINLFDAELPLQKCTELLKTLNCRIIDCEVNSFSKYPFEGEFRILNELGFNELEPRILEAING